MKALNFRIDSFLKEKLGILQKAYNSANISDTLRNLLTKTVDQEIVQHCYQFPASIAVVARKIELERVLNHEEIKLLIKLSRYAYMMQQRKQDYINPDYLLDYLSVLEVLLPHFNDISKLESYHYLCHKLPFDVPKEIKGKENYSLYDAITYNKERILNKPDTHVAEYASRGLSVLIQEKEFLNINISLINNSIKPYLSSLLILAKKGYALENNEPAFHYLDLPLFVYTNFGKYNPNEALYLIFESNLFELRVKPGIELSGMIAFKDNDRKDMSLFLYFKFSEFNDLLRLFINMEKFPKEYVWNGEFFVFTQGSKPKSGWLSYSKVNVWLSREMYDDLHKLVFEVFNKYEQAFLALRAQWGDV